MIGCGQITGMGKVQQVIMMMMMGWVKDLEKARLKKSTRRRLTVMMMVIGCGQLTGTKKVPKIYPETADRDHDDMIGCGLIRNRNRQGSAN